MEKELKRCAAKGCGRKVKHKYCNRCAARNWKESNPVGYYYNALKQNAKRRGKAFELTIEQFEAFAIATDYLNKKGRSSTSLTIDRIDPTKGYTIDNIQVMTNGGNVRKKNTIDAWWNPNQRKMEFYTRTISTQPQQVQEYPF